MEYRSLTPPTFTIERYYPVPPEQVFAAFADPAKKRRWFAEGENSAVVEFTMDFREGGSERAQFLAQGDSPISGTVFTNDTTYFDIVSNRRIVLAYSMSLGNKRISTSLSTFEFLPAERGTTLVLTEQAAFFAGADGAAIREAGCRQLLESLGKDLAG